MPMNRRAPQRRTRAPAPPERWTRHEYTRPTGAQRTYTILVNQWGAYQILLGDKLLRFISDGGDWFGRPRNGSPKLEAQALGAAQDAIDRLVGMEEE